jgi:hypothetical protein
MLKSLVLCLGLVWSSSPGRDSSRVEFLKKIPISQAKTEIFLVTQFAVTEDGLFLLPDERGANIKIFGKDGAFLSAFGRAGAGPGEFGSIWSCDYRAPYLLVSDLHKSEMIRMVRNGPSEFKYDTSRKGVLGAFSNRIWKDKALIAGYIKAPEGRDFELYGLDLKSGEIDYLMPSYMKYGFKSEAEYERRHIETVPLGPLSTIYVFEDDVYHVWEHRMGVLRIHIPSRRISEFGQKTPPYRPPAVSNRMKQYYAGIRDAESAKLLGPKLNQEKRKFSLIFGVFADREVCGVLYQNFDEKESVLKPYLQLYDREGTLLEERLLSEVYFDVSDRGGIPYFYESRSKTLSLMSQALQEDSSIKYEIVQYKIRK